MNDANMSYRTEIKNILEGTDYEISMTDWEGILNGAVANVFDDQNFEPLLENETAVIANGNEKIASLCYDRVWGVSLPGIGFIGNTSAEIALIMSQFLFYHLDKRSPQIALEMQCLLRGIFSHISSASKAGEILTKETISFHVKWLATSLGAKLRKPIIPVYGSLSARDSEYKIGDHQIIVPVLSNLDVVLPDQLEWPQIIEFRKDDDTRRKYRRLVHWLDANMIGKPQSFIEDEIAIKLEDYHYALRKHGVKTATGTISSILDWKHLAAAGTSALSIGVLTEEALSGALVAGAITVGKVAVSVAKSALDLEDVKRGPGSEVAFVHEVTKLTKGK